MQLFAHNFSDVIFKNFFLRCVVLFSVCSDTYNSFRKIGHAHVYTCVAHDDVQVVDYQHQSIYRSLHIETNEKRKFLKIVRRLIEPKLGVAFVIFRGA